MLGNCSAMVTLNEDASSVRTVHPTAQTRHPPCRGAGNDGPRVCNCVTGPHGQQGQAKAKTLVQAVSSAVECYLSSRKPGLLLRDRAICNTPHLSGRARNVCTPGSALPLQTTCEQKSVQGSFPLLLFPGKEQDYNTFRYFFFNPEPRIFYPLLSRESGGGERERETSM